MKTIIVAAGVLALACSGYAQSGIEMGFMAGGAIPTGGDSFLEPLIDPGFFIELPGFSDDFKPGFSWGVYATGPISSMFGWRAEIGRDSFAVENIPQEILDQFDEFDGNYKIWRFQGGIQIQPYGGEAKSKPYGFVTIGAMREDATIDARADGVNVDLDLGNATNFGMSFGGGYNFLVGESWGIGGDIHFNMGNFDDDTRWWVTPSVQAFFKF